MVILSEAERASIASAIEDCEQTTSGEIYCVLADASDGYREVPVAFGVLAAFLVPALVLVASLFQAGWQVGHVAADDSAISLAQLVALQAIVFLLVALIASNSRMKLLLAPRALKRERVYQRALEQFHAHNLHQTSGRTGVLIFVSMSERMAELLADESVDRAVDRAAWRRPMEVLTQALKRNALAEGLTGAVQETGKILARYAPRAGPDINELPDSVVELPPLQPR